jgi:putative transcriptional regulator
MDTSPSLAPALLLSMPQLADPNFNRTVVLLCRHNEEGAFGLVVNRPVMTSGPVIVQVRSDATTERETLDTSEELQVWVGGPVEPQRSWILVGHDEDTAEQERGVSIVDGLYLSTSPELLRRVLGPNPPARTRLIVGYSGWKSGQLEAELRASAWLTSEVDRELIFDTPPDRMWETGLRRLGADPSTLQMSSFEVH